MTRVHRGSRGPFRNSFHALRFLIHSGWKLSDPLSKGCPRKKYFGYESNITAIITCAGCERFNNKFDPLWIERKKLWSTSSVASFGFILSINSKKTEFNQIDNTTPFLIVSKWFSKWIKINLESVLRYLVNEIFRLWILHSMWKSWRSQWSQYLPRLGLLIIWVTRCHWYNIDGSY